MAWNSKVWIEESIELNRARHNPRQYYLEIFKAIINCITKDLQTGMIINVFDDTSIYYVCVVKFVVYP